MVERLQIELVQHIASFLDRDALAKLWLVSRQLYVQVAPLFYSHVTLRIGPTSAKKLALALFLRTILENPARAQLVRKLSVLGTTQDEAPEVGEWRGRAWGLPASRIAERALVTVILQNLPGVQHVEIGFRFLLGLWTPNLPLSKIDRLCPMFSPSTSPSSLRHVTIAADLDDEGRKLYQYAWDESKYEVQSPDSIFAEAPLLPLLFTRLLTLPNLESIDMLVPALNDKAWPRHITYTSLTSISLRSTTCDEQGLLQILSRTPKLKRLFYQRFYDRLQSPEFDSAMLMKALNTIQGSVTSITLEIEVMNHANLGFDPGSTDLEYPGPFAPLEGLTKFSKLESLEIPIELLCGRSQDISPVDILPRNLVTLCLRNDLVYYVDYYPWVQRHLVSLLSAWLRSWADQRPSIEHLELALHPDGFYYSTEGIENLVEDLTTLSAAAGIDFNLRQLRQRSYNRGIDWDRKHIPYET